MKNVPACASPFPRHTARVKVRREAAPCSCRRGDAHALDPCQLLRNDPNAGSRVPRAQQSPGAVASLGAPGSLSAWRPRWDLSSLIEHQAPQLACAVCAPRAAVPGVCRSWVALWALCVSPGELWGDGLSSGQPPALEQEKLKNPSLFRYV